MLASWGQRALARATPVWWHADMIHSVAPVQNQKGWGNVMYIPAAPWCPRNQRYAGTVAAAFLTGPSPTDFAEEHYERDWDNASRSRTSTPSGAAVSGSTEFRYAPAFDWS